MFKISRHWWSWARLIQSDWIWETFIKFRDLGEIRTCGLWFPAAIRIDMYEMFSAWLIYIWHWRHCLCVAQLTGSRLHHTNRRVINAFCSSTQPGSYTALHNSYTQHFSSLCPLGDPRQVANCFKIGRNIRSCFLVTWTHKLRKRHLGAFHQQTYEDVSKRVDNEINNNKHTLRSNTNGYGGRTH
jgi:hypothetical protein